MKRSVLIISITSAALSFMVLSCSNSNKEASMTLKEVSCNFDRKSVGPFLSRVSPLIETGFSSQQVSQVVGSMDELKRKQEKDFEFPIRFHGTPATLKIKVVMDDIDSPNLYIFTTPALADLIDTDLRRFLEEHGL